MFTRQLPIITLLLFVCNLSAQSLAFQKICGIPKDRVVHDLSAVTDGYVVAGCIGGNTPFIQKINLTGDLVWEKTFHTAIAAEITVVQPDPNGGFLLSGTVNIPTPTQSQYLMVLKTNASGELQWSKYFTGKAGVTKIEALADGYLLAGAQAGNAFGSADGCITKIDLSGNVVWSRTYGVIHAQVRFRDFIKENDTYYAYGYFDASGPAPTRHCLAAIDLNTGAVLSARIFESAGEVQPISMNKAADGNFIIAGRTSTQIGAFTKFNIKKVSPTGSLLWSKYYTSTSGTPVYLEKTMTTPDGGILALLNRDVNNNQGPAHTGVAKFNASGEPEWAYSYSGNKSVFIEDGMITPDGSYLIGGTIDNVSIGTVSSQLQTYLIKSDANGNIGGCCKDAFSLNVENKTEAASDLGLLNGNFSQDDQVYTNIYFETAQVSTASFCNSACLVCDEILDLGPDVVLCDNDSVTFNAGEGFASYLWHDGSTGATFSTDQAGDYWVEVTDSCGVTQYDTVTLSFSLVQDIKLPDHTICSDSFVQVILLGLQQYEWTPAAGLSCTDCSEVTIQPAVTTDYSVTAVDNYGCTFADTFRVTVIPVGPALDLGSDVILCLNNTITFNAGDAYATYVWQDGSTASSFTATQPGEYWVEVTDGCGNVQRDTVKMTFSLIADTPIPDQSTCANEAISASLSGFVEYEWAPAAGLSCTNCAQPTILPANTTTYTVRAVDALGCELRDTFTVEILPLATVSQLIEFCPGETVFVNGAEYNQPTVVVDTFAATSGCDTVKTWTLQYFALPQPSNIGIVCADAVTVTADQGASSATVNFQDALAGTDCICDGLQVSRISGPASGSAFPIGVTDVCYKAQDACGSEVNCCVTITVLAPPPPPAPETACDIKETACIRFEVIGITIDAEKNKTYRLRITNKCADELKYLAIGLPDGVIAMNPATNSIYTAASGRQYEVRQPNASPFHSIRFKPVGTDALASNESDVFEYTLPAQSSPVYIHCYAKLNNQVYYETHLNVFNCPVVPETSNRERSDAAQTPGTESMELYPNPNDGAFIADIPGYVQGEKTRYRIFNATGAMVSEGPVTAASMSIDLKQSVAEGVYFFSVTRPDGRTLTQRFVVYK